MGTTYLGQIIDHQVLIEPCQNLRDFIKNIKIVNNISEEIPSGIQEIISGNNLQDLKHPNFSKTEYLVTDEDRKFIESLKLQFTEKPKIPLLQTKRSNKTISENLLNIHDLYWLYRYIQKQNNTTNTKIYLHEIMEGSKICLPKNTVIIRSEKLDTRCKILEAKQQREEYLKMTKNVDVLRKKSYDDTISYHLKMMNRHLIAIFNYVISIITGFVFGFYGIEMMTTPLDVGFRLLLGVIFGLTVALAELYFLARALAAELYDDPPLCYPKTFKIS